MRLRDRQEQIMNRRLMRKLISGLPSFLLVVGGFILFILGILYAMYTVAMHKVGL
jgi:hypothetical protein